MSRARKKTAQPPVNFGESGTPAGFNLGANIPTKRAQHPYTSHEQMELINESGMTGFRWDIRFDGV